MNALSISLLAVLLLPIATAGNKAEAAPPAGAEKQLTSEEKFAYTKKGLRERVWVNFMFFRVSGAWT